MMKLLCLIGIHKWDHEIKYIPSLDEKKLMRTCVRCGVMYYMKSSYCDSWERIEE